VTVTVGPVVVDRRIAPVVADAAPALDTAAATYHAVVLEPQG